MLAYSHCVERRLDVGQQLLAPDVRNDHLFLLLEGSLSVHIDSPDRHSPIRIEPDEWVGEVSIIDGGDVTAWVVADQPCRLLAVPARVSRQSVPVRLRRPHSGDPVAGFEYLE
jgi:CRP-like cAMP-binding protein